MISEVEVAAAAAAWLQASGFEVYHEVAVGDWRADLVGTRSWGGGMHLVVVEAKVALTGELLVQARRWKPQADAVWIAVPGIEDPGDGRRLMWEVTSHYLKVGVLEIVGAEPLVREAAPLLTREDDSLLHALRPEHKTWAPGGSAGGAQYTPHQAWLRRLADFVATDEGCTAEEAVEGSGHPFRTTAGAAGYVLKRAKGEEIEGVHVGWRNRLYPTKEAARRGGTI